MVEFPPADFGGAITVMGKDGIEAVLQNVFNKFHVNEIQSKYYAILLICKDIL